jgi:hypothetical protein
VLSYIVTLGFFIVLAILLGPWTPNKDNASLQIINIVLGALVAAFATVVNFWLGSSQSSRLKEERQANQNAEILDKSAKQNTEVLEQSSKQVAQLQTTIRSMAGVKPAAEATKPTAHFARCVDIVAGYEGKKRRAADPGAIARFGFTLEELRTLRTDKSLTADDLNKLTREEACEIYRSRYWNVLRCDELPIGVDLVVFDFGVDEGPAYSAKALQEVTGAGTDGSVGPVTIAAAKMMSPADVVRKVSQRRSSKDRAQEVAQFAQEMIAGPASAAAA